MMTHTTPDTTPYYFVRINGRWVKGRSPLAFSKKRIYSELLEAHEVDELIAQSSPKDHVKVFLGNYAWRSDAIEWPVAPTP